MALSADTPRAYDPAVEPIFISVPVKASATIYEGSAVSDDSGGGIADPLAAGETFLGFAEEKVVNTVATNGAVNVKLRQQGIIKNLPVTGVSGVTDLGITVYALDSGTFTTSSSSSAVSIGKVVRYVGTGYADVFFLAGAVRSI